MKENKITDVEAAFDQMTLERIPQHVIEHLREKRAEEAAKAQTPAFTFLHERMGSRIDMPVPHDLRGKKVRVTLELVE